MQTRSRAVGSRTRARGRARTPRTAPPAPLRRDAIVTHCFSRVPTSLLSLTCEYLGVHAGVGTPARSALPGLVRMVETLGCAVAQTLRHTGSSAAAWLVHPEKMRRGTVGTHKQQKEEDEGAGGELPPRAGLRRVRTATRLPCPHDPRALRVWFAASS